MNTQKLIEYLAMISNENYYINFGMHLLVIASLVAIFLVKNSKVRWYLPEGTILVLFLTVTINALIYGNPFHATTFGIMSITAGSMFLSKKKEDIAWEFRTDYKMVISILLIISGLWYPELANVNPFESLMLSPVGVIPCPTLTTALGLMNLFSAQINRKLLYVTIFFGMIYGFIGTFKLGVYFDVVLIIAALFSLLNRIPNKARSSHHAYR